MNQFSQLGDNYSHMYLVIQGILQIQIYQISMVAADTCGLRRFISLYTGPLENTYDLPRR
jgi:hypothetical protein